MNWNLFLTIAVAAIVFITSGLGGHLAATKTWHKWVFWGCGSVALILISIQATLNERDKPLTLKDARELLAQKPPANQPQQPSPSDDKAATRPITRDELKALIQQYRAAIPTPLGKFENISNPRVGDMARAIAVDLKEMAGEWRAQDHNDYMKMTDSICYGSSYTPEGCSAAEAQWVIKENDLNVRWREKVKDLVSQANECRMEILSRLLPTQKRFADDDKAKSLFEKMGADSKNISPDNLDAAGLYLNGLWKRLP